MYQRDSVKGTFLFATVLCVVCSILVATAAVSLRSTRLVNEQLSFQREVLSVAGLYSSKTHTTADIPELFQQVIPMLIDLETGAEAESTTLTVENFDLEKISRDPELTVPIPAQLDLVGMKHREAVTKIYLVKNDDGSLDQVILPVRGQGLWATMWGLLSLDSDGKTVRGLTFYNDKETPGLGGEINNPAWKAIWGHPECPKVLFDEQGIVTISFSKIAVNCETPNSQHLFDGLAGSTITARGVENMFKYWLGEHGYGPLLKRLQAGEFEVGMTEVR